jgi:hypothetical protein
MPQDSLPEFMREERDAIVAEIYAAWKGVTREGGVSWSETTVIDDYGTIEQRLAAREHDQDRTWETLVDDPTWRVSAAFGGFSFLDPIGFRYYIAPELVRCLRTGWSEALPFHLTIAGGDPYDSIARHLSLLSIRQSHCIARSIRFMVDWHGAAGNRHDATDWLKAHESYWESLDAE